MIKHYLFCLFLLYRGFIYSQEVRQLYFDSNWKLTSSLTATYTRSVEIAENDLLFRGALTDVNKDGNLITKGQYLNGNKQGSFIFNFEDGSLNRKGAYENDKPVGIWEFYYANGQLKYKIEFLSDDFKILTFNDENGNSKMEGVDVLWEYAYANGTGIKGRLTNGQKHGNWELIENSRVVGYEIYKNGKYKKTFETLFKRFTKSRLISNLVFTPLYLTYSERLEVNESVSQEDYPFLKNLLEFPVIPVYEDLGGVGLVNEEIILNLDKPPLLKGGLTRIKQILIRNIRTSKELDGISGRVFIDLYINEEGNPYQVEIVRSDNKLMNVEALRLAQLITEWKPAIYQGERIASKVTLPLKLSFNQHKQN